MSIEVEIKFTPVSSGLTARDRTEEQTKTIELLKRLQASFFPLLIIKKDGLTISLQDFVEAVELRESFGKNPNQNELLKAFGLDLQAVRDEICAQRGCCAG